MATVLGTGNVSGADTLTVTLSAAQPPGSFVHFIHAALLKDLNFFSTPRVITTPTDSQGGTWDDASGAAGAPILGASSNGGPAGAVAPNRAGLQIGETARRTPLSGPDLGIGDTVSVTWDDNGFGASHMRIVGAVVAFAEYQDAVTQYLGGTTPGDFAGVYYSNGNDDALMPSVWDGQTLNWTDAFLDLPYPHDTAMMLTGAAIYPGAPNNSYAPAEGSVIFEIDTVDLSLAAALAPAPALTAIEPGGQFVGASGKIMVGNYQFAVGAAAGLRAWQRF